MCMKKKTQARDFSELMKGHKNILRPSATICSQTTFIIAGEAVRGDIVLWKATKVKGKIDSLHAYSCMGAYMRIQRYEYMRHELDGKSDVLRDR